ncbi:S8 family serine peptidase [Candidatus Bipolaricaulota bacterium]|nr:S8 family serine peptidase [Candidatus Bipolaricaulota bacterium]
MNCKAKTMGKQPAKVLAIILAVGLTLISFQISFHTPIAGRAGASSISAPSSGSTRWGLETVKAKDAWEITQGSDEVVVAVIDSGIDRSIPALKDRMWTNDDEVPGDGKDNDGNGYVDDVSGWDFRNGDTLNKSEGSLYYHGTFVSGLVSSSYDKETGSGGVAPNVSIMDLRFLDSAGRFYTSDWGKLADGIDYAVENGADIINMSIYANAKPPELVHEALRRAQSEGVLIVGISGNNGERLGYFGKWNEVFTVGSVNKSGKVSNFSNYGPELELVAPGAEVLSYRPGGNLATGSGTSFAAPHVAGTAALILSKQPQLSLSDLKRTLRESAKDIGKSGKDDSTGYGLIDADRSLGEIAGTEDSNVKKTEGDKKDKVDRPKVDRPDEKSDIGVIQTVDGKVFRTGQDI